MSTANKQPASTSAATTPAPKTTAKAKAQIRGSLDGAPNNQAVGWAYNADTPKKRLMVEIVSENRVVAYGLADQFRPDLAKAKIGDGHHRFLLNLSYEILDGKPHTLSARDAETGIVFGTFQLKPAKSPYDFDLISRAEGEALLDNLLKQPAFNKVAKRPEEIKVLHKQATLAQETGRLEEAEKTWSNLAKELGENSLCYYKLGETYLLAKKYEQAVNAFQAALNITPNLYLSFFGKSNAQRLLKKFKEAMCTLSEGEKLNTKQKNLFTSRLQQVQKQEEQYILTQVENLINNKNFSKAISLLKDIIWKNPDNTSASDLLGDILILQLPPEEMSLDKNSPETKQFLEFKKSLCLLDFILTEVQHSTENHNQQSKK